jgi:hypothetical protein
MSGFEKVGSILVAGLVAVTLVTTMVGPGKQTPAVISSGGNALSGSLLAAQGQQGT